MTIGVKLAHIATELRCPRGEIAESPSCPAAGSAPTSWDAQSSPAVVDVGLDDLSRSTPVLVRSPAGYTIRFLCPPIDAAEPPPLSTIA
jgi:hypothetical protein